MHHYANFFYYDLDLSPVELTTRTCFILDYGIFVVRYTYIVIVAPNGTRQIDVHERVIKGV